MRCSERLPAYAGHRQPASQADVRLRVAVADDALLQQVAQDEGEQHLGGRFEVCVRAELPVGVGAAATAPLMVLAIGTVAGLGPFLVSHRKSTPAD